MNNTLIKNSWNSENNWENFIVWKNDKFIFTIEKSWDYFLNFSHNSNNSNSKIVVLIFCNNSKIKLNLISEINSPESSSNIIILNFALNGEIDIQSSLKITNNWVNSKGSLEVENIFLWDNSKIKVIPALDIHLEKTESKHSVKATKINDDELFYLSSRWIGQENAKYMILKSKIIKALSIFGNIEENMIIWIMEKFEKFILRNT